MRGSGPQSSRGLVKRILHGLSRSGSRASTMLAQTMTRRADPRDPRHRPAGRHVAARRPERRLAHRLRPRPRARCCSMRLRAAATRPTPRSTRSCRSACSCRGASEDVAAALDIARELNVPVLPRGAGTSQCGQTTGAALVIDNSKHLRQVLAVDQDAMTADGRAGAGARSSERRAEAARPVVPGRRLDQRPGDPRRHGRQQFLRLALDRLRQHGAQRAGHRRLAVRRQRAVVRPGAGLGAREREIAAFVRGLAEAPTRRDRGALAEGAAPGRRLQPRHLPSRRANGPTPTTTASTSPICWSAPKARSPSTAA